MLFGFLSYLVIHACIEGLSLVPSQHADDMVFRLPVDTSVHLSVAISPACLQPVFRVLRWPLKRFR